MISHRPRVVCCNLISARNPIGGVTLSLLADTTSPLYVKWVWLVIYNQWEIFQTSKLPSVSSIAVKSQLQNVVDLHEMICIHEKSCFNNSYENIQVITFGCSHDFCLVCNADINYRVVKCVWNRFACSVINHLMSNWRIDALTLFISIWLCIQPAMIILSMAEVSSSYLTNIDDVE